jgi:hypothetical protein
MLAACPQLRDEDFQTVPGGVLSRPDAGDGVGGGAIRPPRERDASVAAPAEASAAELRAALAHRYAFDGTGTVAIDTIAGSDATLIATTLDGTGSLTLDGDDAYVDLPNRVLSAANEQTIEAWLTWSGGRPWQRIFDFGSSDGGEGERGNGRTYLFLTPRSADDAIVLAYSSTGYSGETRLNADVPFPIDVLAHVTVVVDSPGNALSLYLDGRWLATEALEQRLSEIDDVNCWLGMAQFENDPGLSATLTEFRLYHRALSGAEVELSHALGPDAAL